MSNVTPSSLNPSSSTLERRLKFMESLTRQPADINKLVNAAHEKLSPVIESIVRNPKKDSNFITKQQFEDAVIASKIIGDVNSILKLDTIEKLVNNLNFDLDNVNVVINNNGLIFVDTALLLHLIDLHALLEEFMEYVDPTDVSEATDCLVQTDSCITCDTPLSPKLNKFTIKMTRPQSLVGDNQEWPALTDFLVLPAFEAAANNDNDPNFFIPHIEKGRSEGFLTEEETTNITNVVGARDIIEKCICDLERVQCFLEADFKKPVTDSGTDMRREPSEKQQRSRERSIKALDQFDDGETDHQGKTDSNECCCSDSCGKFDLDKDAMGVCGDDNVVICIKGRNPDEGDVQIVIRQCPDCRSVCAPCPSTSQTDRGVSPDREISGVSPEKQEKKADKRSDDSKTIYPEKFEKTEQPSEESYGEVKQGDTTRQLEEETDLEEQDSKPPQKIPPADEVPAGGMKRASRISADKISEKSGNSAKLEEQTISNLPREQFKASFNKSSQLTDNRPPKEEPSEPPPEQSETDILKKLSDLNVILPPVPPPTPKDEPKETQTPTEVKPKSEKPPKQQQFRTEVGCSKMQMFESKKLCLSTEQGEELLITLTVTPNNQKNLDDRQLILKDLFSEEDSSIPNKQENQTYVQEEPSKNQGHQTTMEDKYDLHKEEDLPMDDDNDQIYQEAQDNTYEEENEETETQINYFQKDRVIPLERTKVCSSMEFDVKLVDTKFRKKGINPNNQSILVQLKEIGVDNLLRACRPAKCCRKAVLNEKMKKYLPYPPSLKSLPLDEDDLNVINQSLQMSLQKVKNSTDLTANYQENQAYCLNNFKVMYSLIDDEDGISHEKQWPENKRMNYYINLANDDREQGPLLQYNVMYFEVQNDSKDLPKCRNADNRLRMEHVNNLEIISEPIPQINSKFKCREERPLIGGTGFSNTQSKANVPKIFTELSQIQTLVKPTTALGVKKDYRRETKKSKIPVLQPKLLKLMKVEEHNNKINYDADILSLESQYQDTESFKSQPSAEEYLNLLLSRSNSFLKKRNSRNIIPRGKRKKPEFCCARSKSEISLNNTLHHSLKSITENVTSNKLSSVKVNTATSAIQNLPQKSYKDDKEIESLTKLVMQHLSLLLYKIIRREIVHDAKILGITSTKSLIVSNGSQGKWSFEEKIHKEIECCLMKDQDSITSEKLFDDAENSLPVQASLTSQLKLINQGCQTLNVWSFSKPYKRSTPLPRNYNKQYYKKEDFIDSCDEMENFIVVFKSEHSVEPHISDMNIVATNLSTIVDVVSDPSSTLEISTEESISKSLLKLKETLKNCDHKLNTKKRNVIMDPVEYMVYNNYVKSSSFIQKLINKTKSILKNSEETCTNIGNKYCQICKCETSKCIHQDTENSTGCACPETNKKSKQINVEIKKTKAKSKPGKSWCDLSRIKSMSTFKDLKSRIQKSITNILKRSKGQYVNMSASSKPCKNKETMACSPQCVKRRENMRNRAQPCETLLRADELNYESFGKNVQPKDTKTSTRRLEISNDNKSDFGAGFVPVYNENDLEENLELKVTSTKRLETFNRKDSGAVIMSPAKNEYFDNTNSTANFPVYEEEIKASTGNLRSSLKEQSLQGPTGRQERPSKSVTLNQTAQSITNMDNIADSPNIEINFDDCFCRNCDENDGTCCCETCPGCSGINKDEKDYIANHVTVENGPRIIIAAAKPDEIKYFNIGSNYQPIYSVVLPHNVFDINDNVGCSNPFQSNRYNPPQHRFWQFGIDTSFGDIFKGNQ